MTKLKKAVFGGIAGILAAVLAAGGVLTVRKANAEAVMVVPVESISTYMYGSEENMEGRVSTSLTQRVKLEQDTKIKEVYVKQGDHVNRGDRLISFDMTLKEMELEIAVLTRQQQQQELEKAKKRLKSLENGGPITEEREESGPPASSFSEDDAWEEPEDPPLFPDDLPEDLDSTEAPGSLSRTAKDGTQSSSIAYGMAGMLSMYGSVSASIHAAPMSFEAETEVPGFAVEETPLPTAPPKEEPPAPAAEGLCGVLYGLQQNSGGSGTKEDPYLFRCAAKNGEIFAKGTFLNELAGCSADGSELLSEGGYWFRLEFHDETLWDANDPEASLLAYTVQNGGLQKDPAVPDDERTYRIADAKPPAFALDPEQVVTPLPTEEPEEPTDDGYDDGGDWWDDGDEPDDSEMSREDAIKQQKRLIKDLELQIKASDLKISKLQRALEKKTVTSKVNGTVKKMGDPATGTYDGDAFMLIQSDGGYFVKGSLSELMLGVLQPGDRLNCMSFESGANFQAEILEISEYPGASSDFYGSGNTNASYYPFLASVVDEIELNNDEYVNITLQKKDTSDQVGIMNAFVRSENGQYYVYKEQDGVLKKQIVEAKVSTDGYSVQIFKGLKRDDRIAFPYGKSVKEGAKTREGTMEELYGIY